MKLHELRAIVNDTTLDPNLDVMISDNHDTCWSPGIIAKSYYDANGDAIYTDKSIVDYDLENDREEIESFPVVLCVSYD